MTLGRPGVCGERSDGSVACWGGAYDGQVTPAAGPFASLSAGDAFTCGMKSDASVHCWGGVDGEGPAPLTGSFLEVAGSGSMRVGHVCGVRTDHALVCRGYSPPIAGGVTDVAVALFDGCAILQSTGAVSCWTTGGVNPTPVPPSGVFTQISGGGNYESRYCGVRADGTVACWRPSDSIAPVADPPGGTFAKVFVGSAATSCGIRTDGTLACWKPGSWAGPGSPPAGTYVDVAVGDQAACAVGSDHAVRCWGRGDYDEATPPAGSFVQIVGGEHHFCARRADGSVACWGHGEPLGAG